MTDEISVATDLNDQQRAAWDAFVDSVPYADVTQLTGWAEVRAAAGFSPVYLLAKDGDRLIAGAQLLRRRVPVLGWIYYLSGGPLLGPDLAGRNDVIRQLTRGLASLLEHRCRMLFIQPPFAAPDVSRALLDLGFRPSKAKIAPPASLRVDLSRPVEDIRAGMKRKLRNWSRRWQASGVTTRLGDVSGIALLAGLLQKSAAFQHYQPLSRDYITRMYETLEPAGNAVLFVGQSNGVPVAVTLYTKCGGVLRGRLTGFDRDSDALKLNVPSAVAWDAMLWARENGVRWFDFGGIQITTADALLAGRSLDQQAAGGCDFFKIAFGGEAILMPPAVESASPRLLLDTLDAVQGAKWGQGLITTLQRRMRGGLAEAR